MFQENTQNKEQLSEILSILVNINKDIIHLHDYAAEDFTNMRNAFKDNNIKAEKLAHNTKKAFELIGASNDSGVYVNELDEYFNNVSDCYKNIRKKTESTLMYVRKLCRNIELMIIPAKNLNQQIVSLKLVLANNKLYSSFRSKSEPLYNDLDLIFDKIKNIYVSCSEGIESMQRLLGNVKEHIGQLENPHLENLNDFLKRLDQCKGQFLQKHEEALRQIPELSTKIIDNIGNSHKIIIELQYHDIIRQKIEHVKKSHDQIIQQLTEYRKENNDSANNEITKYLAKVGDIVRIQASQLLNANKEYESAMDTISEELLSFSDNMTGIVNLCNKLSIDNTNLPQCGIDDIITKHTHFRIKMSDASVLLDEQYTLIKNELKSMTVDFDNINTWIGKLVSFLHMTDKKNPDFEDSRKASNKQINDLLKDITSTTQYLKELFENISAINNEQIFGITQDDNKKEFSHIIEMMLDHEQKFLPDFNKSNEIISAIYKENSNYTGNLTDNNLKAIRSIKYYDYFNKLADDIINKLNYISNTYTIHKPDESLQNVEEVKNKYTMYSERRIHDITLTHGKSNAELFDEVNNQNGSGITKLF